MRFNIKLNEKIVGVFVEDNLRSKDLFLSTIFSEGVKAQTGDIKNGIASTFTRVIQPDDPGFLVAFIRKILSEGYEIPFKVFEEVNGF